MFDKLRRARADLTTMNALFPAVDDWLLDRYLSAHSIHVGDPAPWHDIADIDQRC